MKRLAMGWAVWMVCVVCLAQASPLAAPLVQRLDMPLRGRAMALSVYRPAGPPRGTIIMGSGDVGWVGLAVARADTTWCVEKEVDRGPTVATRRVARTALFQAASCAIMARGMPWRCWRSCWAWRWRFRCT